MDSKRIGRYQILGKIDRGTAGSLLRASDPVTGRMVAIKPIHAAFLAGDQGSEFREWFYRQARAAEALTDPGIVPVFDVGEDNGVPFLVTELVEGRTLASVIEHGERYPLDRACEICQQIADALGYAHRMGVVHRGLNPTSILITSRDANGAERPRITDFGMAKLADLEKIAREQLLAAQEFMSPEQFTGAQVDGRTDLYSLGVILYWMTTGKLPFNDEPLKPVSYNVVHTAPMAPSKVNPAVPPQLESVILKCLAKSPTDRYATGEELFTNLALVRMGALGSFSNSKTTPAVPTVESQSGDLVADFLPHALRTFAGSAPAYMSLDSAPAVPPTLNLPPNILSWPPERTFAGSAPVFKAMLSAPLPAASLTLPIGAQPRPVIESAPVAARLSASVPLPGFLARPEPVLFAELTAPQPAPKRGVFVLMGLVLLLGAVGTASVLFPKSTTEASQQTSELSAPEQQHALKQQVDFISTQTATATPAPQQPPESDSSSAPDPSAPMSALPIPPVEAEPANPTQAQAEMMNDQLNAPARIPRDAKIQVAENTPPPSNFVATGSDSLGSNSAIGGVFKAQPQPVVKAALPPTPIAISAGVATGLLIQKTTPIYPLIAKQARVAGTVSLQATISKVGTIEDLHVSSGPAMLRQAAVDAVRTWRFKPYMLDNDPIEVETTINIVFTLGG